MSTSRPLHVLLVVMLASIPFAGTACGDSSVTAPAAAEPENLRADELSVPMEVAPAMLVLGAPGTCVTVHAEIPYGEVDHTTLALNGVDPTSVKSDNRGELVVKFAREDIEGIVSPPEATLVLTGLTVSGTPFSGSDTIAVQ